MRRLNLCLADYTKCTTDYLVYYSQLAQGLTAHQASLTGLVCSVGPLAQSSRKHSHSPIQSFIQRPLDMRPSFAWSLVPYHNLRL